MNNDNDSPDRKLIKEVDELQKAAKIDVENKVHGKPEAKFSKTLREKIGL